MNDILLSLISSSAIASIVTAIINAINEKSKSNDITHQALMSLMGMNLRDACENSIKDGKITFSKLKQVQEMNKIYVAIGGDGYIKNLMSRVESLPIEED